MELADLYLTLRAVNAPMLEGFKQVTAAGEEMVAALSAQMAEFDAMVERSRTALAELRGEAGAVGAASPIAAGEAVATAAPAAAGEGETIAAEQELAAATETTAATYTAAKNQMRDELGRFTSAEAKSTDEILAGYAKQMQANAELRAEFEATTAAMTAQAEKAATATKQVGTAMDDSAVTAKAAATKWGLVAGAAALVGLAVVHTAADFQTSTNKLVTSAGESATAVVDSSGKTVGGIDMVRQGLLSMASQVGVSATALSQAMYVIESAGYHGAAGLGVLKSAEEGAKAEGADATTVADALSSAMRDYYPKAQSAADVTKASADVMSKFIGATSAGKMTFDQLAGALASVLPVASAAHIGLNDVLGSLAAMTVHGMSAERSTQNMADAIRHLETAATNGTMTAGLAALGISATKLSQNLGSTGLSGAVNQIANAIQDRMGPGSTRVVLDLNDALKLLPPSVQQLGQSVLDGTMSMADFTSAARAMGVLNDKEVTSFATLAGSFHKIGSESESGAKVYQTYAGAMRNAMGDATGLNVALMLTGQNAQYTHDAIAQVTAATADAAGNVKGWSEIQGTFNQKVSEAKNGLGALAIQVGSVLLPPITKIISVVGQVSAALSQNRTVATALAVVIGGTFSIALVGAIGKLLQVGKGAITAAGQLGLLAGALSFGMSNMHEWYGVATLVVTGLVAIGVAMKALSGPFGQMKTAFQTAKMDLQIWIEEIGAAEGAMATFKAVGSGVLSFLTGPWGMAIGAAIAAFSLFSSSSSKATQDETDFTGALQQDSGALGENTRAQAENTLEKDDAGKAASQLGINMSTLTDAVLGNKNALDQVNQRMATFFKNADDAKQGMISSSEQTRTNAASYLLLANAIPQVTKSVNDSIDAYHRQQQAGVAAAGATSQAGSTAATAANQTQDLTKTQGNLATAMAITSSATNNVAATVGSASDAVTTALNSASAAAKDLSDQMNLLDGNNISAEQALITVRDDVDKVTQSFKQNGKTIDDNTAAGRTNVTAILEAVTAAQKHAEAVAQQTGHVEDGTAAFQQDISALQGVMKNAGMTAQQIQDLTNMYMQVPHDLTTTFNTPGLDSAISGTAQLAQNMGNVPRSKGGARGFATGGLVGFPIGGPVSGPGTDTSDSIAAMLSNNEFVVNAAAARSATYPVLNAINAGNLRQAYSLLGGQIGSDGARTPTGFGFTGGVSAGGGGATIVNVYIQPRGSIYAQSDLQKDVQAAVLQYANRNTGGSQWVPAFSSR